MPVAERTEARRRARPGRGQRWPVLSASSGPRRRARPAHDGQRPRRRGGPAPRRQPVRAGRRRAETRRQGGGLGAGAGFPGLPLAIALPGARLDLVESTRRKCAVIGRLSGGRPDRRMPGWSLPRARTGRRPRARGLRRRHGARGGAAGRPRRVRSAPARARRDVCRVEGGAQRGRGGRRVEAAEMVGLRPVDVSK